ncbi:MAG: aminopeptidase P family protein [Chloroflexi bacterium]|nr:aminopeptidase P family protein [Chloroflexota bacterium]
MPDFGFMGVDWEERINFDRLRRERVQKAKDALAKSDADVLFVFRDEDVRYLTGLRGHLGPVCAFHHSVVLPKGGDPILLTNLHAHCKARMPWMPPGSIQTTPAGARFRSKDGARLWAGHIRSLIGDLVDGKIGVDIWTVDMEEGLREALPKAQFVNGYKILLGAKMIKTKDELECQRAAYAITEAGMDAALRLLKPGIRECEVLAEAWRVFTNLGSEWTQCSNIVASGPYTAPYRLFTSDRIIREGDPVILDIGACFNGYWGDLTRTYICGDIMPTKELKALHQEDYDALFNACAAARPGNTNYDIWKNIQNEHSGGMSGGHSAGVSPWEPPYLSGYHPEHTPDATTTLVPGMIFSVEPYAGIPGIGGIRLENNVIVTEGDPDIYSTYPFDERMLDHTHPLDKTTGRRMEFRRR